MDPVKCTSCGSNEFNEIEARMVCVYCQTTFSDPTRASMPKASVISVSSDIEALLQKCREDPRNRKRYAGLILDIDPTNPEAQQYLHH